MIVIAMPSATKQNYNSAEAQIIGQFVNEGGNLLILAEAPGFTNRINEVTSYFNRAYAFVPITHFFYLHSKIHILCFKAFCMGGDNMSSSFLQEKISIRSYKLIVIKFWW